MDTIKYSDGFEWVPVHYEIAKLLLTYDMEVCQLYLDEEAEGVVCDLADLDERNSQGATFGVWIEDVRAASRP